MIGQSDVTHIDFLDSNKILSYYTSLKPTPFINKNLGPGKGYFHLFFSKYETECGMSEKKSLSYFLCKVNSDDLNGIIRESKNQGFRLIDHVEMSKEEIEKKITEARENDGKTLEIMLIEATWYSHKKPN